MKRITLITSVSLGIISLGSLWLFKGSKTDRKKENQLVVGTASGYAPFVSLNEQGDYEGFDIDFSRELAQTLKKELVIKDLGNMSSLLLAIDKDKIDVAIWALSITPERRQQFAMINYQGDEVTALPLMFWNKIPEDISSIYDLKNYPSAVVAVEPGSSNEQFLSQFSDFITIKPMEKIVDAILDLKYGKTFATVIDPALVPELTKQYPELEILWVPLGKDWSILGNGVGINKKNKQLITDVEKAVTQLKKNGTIKRLEQKWNVKG